MADHSFILATIRQIRDSDSDFITPETIVAYTGCTVAEARSAIGEVFGEEWLAKQDRSHSAVITQGRDLQWSARLNGRDVGYRFPTEAAAQAAVTVAMRERYGLIPKETPDGS